MLHGSLLTWIIRCLPFAFLTSFSSSWWVRVAFIFILLVLFFLLFPPFISLSHQFTCLSHLNVQIFSFLLEMPLTQCQSKKNVNVKFSSLVWADLPPHSLYLEPGEQLARVEKEKNRFYDHETFKRINRPPHWPHWWMHKDSSSSCFACFSSSSFSSSSLWLPFSFLVPKCRPKNDIPAAFPRWCANSKSFGERDERCNPERKWIRFDLLVAYFSFLLLSLSLFRFFFLCFSFAFYAFTLSIFKTWRVNGNATRKPQVRCSLNGLLNCFAYNHFNLSLYTDTHK